MAVFGKILCLLEGSKKMPKREKRKTVMLNWVKSGASKKFIASNIKVVYASRKGYQPTERRVWTMGIRRK